jgi:hypothetical protein
LPWLLLTALLATLSGFLTLLTWLGLSAAALLARLLFIRIHN